MNHRVAYVAVSAAKDQARWSGLNYHIGRSVADHVGSLDWIGPLKQCYKPWFRARQLMAMLVTGRRRLLDREPVILKRYARQAAALLACRDVDLVFCPGTLPIAYLECRQPIFFWTDATFAGLLGFYINRRIVANSAIRDGNAAEESALERCRLAIYASEWAAQSAITNYGVDPDKVKVVPFGANLEPRGTYDEVRQMIVRRPHDCCRLLFVGVDWVRKGGDIALAIAQRLNDEGLRTELTVAGCEPKVSGRPSEFVKRVGFLDKTTTAEGRIRLERLYAESHFLVLPSRAETYGLVLAEACAFALPCIASNVGGIPTIVRDGVNGITFNIRNIEPVCSYIEGLMANRSQYEQLALSSFAEYERRLNWNVAGKTVRALIEDHL